MNKCFPWKCCILEGILEYLTANRREAAKLGGYGTSLPAAEKNDVGKKGNKSAGKKIAENGRKLF